MAKNKERSELEYIRAQNRNLKSELRHVKKQLARFEKRSDNYQDLEERVKEIELEEEFTPQPDVINICPKCGGKMKKIDIVIRQLTRCEDCNYRESKK